MVDYLNLKPGEAQVKRDADAYWNARVEELEHELDTERAAHAETQKEVERLRAENEELRRYVPACWFFGECRCTQRGRWLFEWSDRRATYCDEHKSAGFVNYAGDHDYDQTWLTVTDLTGQAGEETYTTSEALAKAAEAAKG